PPSPTPVATDPDKIRQILRNLLSNAVKFTERARIDVRVAVEEDTIVMEVRDTRIGISPEYLETIFDPFWQVEQGSTRGVAGAGAGPAPRGRRTPSTVRVPARSGRRAAACAPARGDPVGVRRSRAADRGPGDYSAAITPRQSRRRAAGSPRDAPSGAEDLRA